MKILVIGGSGMAGSAIVAEALKRGHQVTATARDTSKIAPQPGLTVEALDIADSARLAALASQADVVVGAISPRTTGNPQAETAAYADALIANLGDTRAIVVGGAGTLNLPDGTAVADVVPDAYAGEAKGMRAAYEALSTSGLDLTYFAPAGEFFPGAATGTYRIGGRTLMSDADGKSRISTGDYAAALLDEVEAPRHPRGLFSIAY